MGVSAVSPGRVSFLLAQLQRGGGGGGLRMGGRGQELGHPTPFKEAQGGPDQLAAKSFCSGFQAISKASDHSPVGISPLPWQVGQVTKLAPAVPSRGRQEQKDLLHGMLE